MTEEVCLMNFKDNEHSVTLNDLKKVKEEAIKIGIICVIITWAIFSINHHHTISAKD
ncbi:hypothetical protein DDB_G0284665 [Dictyostelium discoideum AX4]|uniref:Putative uncharacterized protein DDB_G0284665 n=1 Tax=Dictyostelium discoideum TaxID=44689 RepID=Y6129_DICDI|nr:hypothetical protein DDB_G0284665 [Dictyostelium discoideum AX4]Q54PB1.1 RecName: Full=Putative uncharacterized protein DDB_G0284665 [Dictyostelium discoideum]EAL65102.1 hypothetical protein DDB_G0284665 [Dictyostelium discoideum AX4]|eukprot:XP_638464.1 hypothetical protein DDB_G0284665 [Dictyostelium discoideum AX4]